MLMYILIKDGLLLVLLYTCWNCLAAVLLQVHSEWNQGVYQNLWTPKTQWTEINIPGEPKSAYLNIT